jgi:hypothetical protein
VKNRQQLLIIGAVIIAALYICDTIVRPPIEKIWTSRKSAIKKLQDDIKRGKNMIASESALNRRWDLMRTNTLPLDTATAENKLMTAINIWAERDRVTLGGVNPQWKHDMDDTYSTLDCRVEASGTLATLTRFIYDIESDPMGLKFESLELTARDDRGTQMAVQMQISGLVLGSKSEQNLQAAAKTQAEE